MNVNIALLTVTDTRTFDNDKSGAILVEKIKEANHNLIDRKICKDNKEDIVLILNEWIKNNDIDVMRKNIDNIIILEIFYECKYSFINCNRYKNF